MPVGPEDGVATLSTMVIAAFVIDEDNAEKFWRHGLRPERVLEALEHPFRVRKYRRGRHATHLVIGRDHQGQCIAIPIAPSPDPVVWRPVTAWPCKPSEWALLP